MKTKGFIFLLQAIGIYFFFCFYFLAVYLVVILLFLPNSPHYVWKLIWAFFASLTAGLTFGYALLKGEIQFSDLGFNNFYKRLLQGLLAVILYFLVKFLIFFIFFQEYSPSQDPLYESNYYYKNLFLKLVLISLLPAVFEELFFRGVLLFYSLKMNRPYLGIFLSSFLFAILHNWQLFILYFIFGVFFGVIAMKTRSVLPSIIVHFANNAISVLSIHFFPAFFQ